MPSKTFQPLLFDGFKYRLPNTTYIDHYGRKLKRKEFNSLHRTNSANLTQSERASLLTKRSRPFTSSGFIRDTQKYRSQDDLNLKNNNNNNNNNNKKPLTVNFHPTVIVTEISQRGSITPSNSTSLSMNEINEKIHPKLTSPPPSSPFRSKSIVDATDEQLNNVTEKLEKAKLNEKSQEKNNYHWMVFLQDETPNYIVEAKKRLGQMKQPHIAPNQVNNKPPKTPEKIKEEIVLVEETPKVAKTDQLKPKHWFYWDNPSTPENVVEIRRRLGDDRYRRSNLPPQLIARSKTFDSAGQIESETNKPAESSDIKNEHVKVAFEEKVIITNHEENERPNEIIIEKSETKIPDDSNKYVVSYVPTSEFVQTIYKTNEPYYQIANTFNYFDMNKEQTDSLNNNYHENYSNLESLNENNNYILPTKDSQVLINQTSDINQQNIDTNRIYINNSREATNGVPLQTWVQNATDQDREAVLRILKSIEDTKPLTRNQSESRLSSRLSNPFNQYTTVKAKQSKALNLPSQLNLKKRPITPSSVRKLGVTRNKYNAPIDDNLEKILIKHSLWSNEINGPATVHFGYNV